MTNGKQKNFDSVKFFRKVKDKISKDISDMSYEKFLAYINKHSLKV